MEVNEIRNMFPVRALHRELLTLGAMALLGLVWLALFLWATAVTESGLIRWGGEALQTMETGWQQTILTFLASDSGIFVPGALLFLISLALYFYRVPRAQGPLAVPLEFAASTMIFLLIDVAVIYGLYLLLERPLLAEVVTDLGRSQLAAKPYLTEPGLFLTVVMLLGLFWLQATGRVRRYWQRLSFEALGTRYRTE